MTRIASKYTDYSMRAGEDLPGAVYYDENAQGSDLLRVHFRIARIPSRKEFVLRHRSDSNEQDRGLALTYLDTSLPALFARCEARGFVSRHMSSVSRFWYYVLPLGTPVEDPLVQLELEMMIDEPLRTSIRSIR